MKFQVTFFTPAEFRCRCGCGRIQAASGLVLWLELFRRAWGGPVRVTSGYRCPAWNAHVGGADRSRHLLGCAADIQPVTPDLIGPFQALVGDMSGRLLGWEVRMYPRFCHVAVPREETIRLWGGGSILLEPV